MAGTWNRGAAVVLVVSLAGLGLYYGLADTPQRDAVGRGSLLPESQHAELAEARAADAEPTPFAGDPAVERVVAAGAPAVVVAGEAGVGLAGTWGLVSSSTLPLHDGRPDWTGVDWEELSRSMRELVANADGGLSVAAAEEGLAAAKLPWICVGAPGHELWVNELEQFRAQGSTLAFAEPHMVYIRDEFGRSVAGAELRWIATAAPERQRGTTTVPAREIAAFARSWASAHDGSIALPPSAGFLWLEANKEGRRSNVWSGPAGGAPLTLFLGDGFAAHGQVEGDGLPKTGLSVVVHLEHEAVVTPLVHLSVGPDGHWQAQGLPCVAGAEYVFRLESEAGVPYESVLRAPSPESTVEVELKWVAGIRNTVRVIDTTGAAIAGARIAQEWSIAGHTIALEQRSDAAGIVEFANSPRGDVIFYGEAPGYAAQRTLSFASPLIAPFDFVLQQGGAVEGFCRMAGVPVENFTVHYFTTEHSRPLQQEFRGHADGSFRLECAPVGGLSLFASTRSLPMGSVVALVVQSGGTAHADLELLPLGEAFGQAVDVQSGEGLAQATAQVYLSAGGRSFGPWGAPVEADAQGYFQSIPVSRAGGEIVISAPGYASRTITRLADSDGRLDLEVVALERPRAVIVRLQVPPGTDCSEYALDAEGSLSLPRTPFGEDCSLSIDSIPGTWVYWGVYPPGQQSRIDILQDMSLFPLKEVVLAIDSGRSLTVTAYPVEGTELPKDIGMSCTFLSAQGLRTVHNVALPDSGTHTIQSVVGEDVVIDISVPSGKRLAVRRLHCAADEDLTVEIPVGSPERLVRFVTPDQVALAAATVWTSLPKDPTGWQYMAVTDVDGVVRLEGIESDTLLFSVDYQGSRASNLSALLSGSSEEVVEVVVDLQASFHVRLLEHGTPQPRLRLGQFDGAERRDLISDLEANEQGLATNPKCTPGEYWVRILSEGYWSPWLKVRAESASPQYNLEVRSLGALAFEASRQGVALAGVAIELISEEFPGTVADWQRDGSLVLPPTTFITDSAGRLLLDGLPNGRYQWQARTAGGQVLSGQVHVPVLDTQTVALQFP